MLGTLSPWTSWWERGLLWVLNTPKGRGRAWFSLGRVAHAGRAGERLWFGSWASRVAVPLLSPACRVTLASRHHRFPNFKASSGDKMISMFLQDRILSYLLFPGVPKLRQERTFNLRVIISVIL